MLDLKKTKKTLYICAMKIAVIDYNAGNIRSVLLALERLGASPVLTADHEVIASADKVIFPGQGEARSAMRHLRERGLDALIPKLKQPFLGVCVGMQLLCAHSEENDTPCLGVIPLGCKKFPNVAQKVPQVGWNKLKIAKNEAKNGLNTGSANPLVMEVSEWASGILTPDLDDEWFYFVHSYYVELGDFTTATADYGVPFSACLRKDNFHAAQFHPEKSSQAGEKMLQNFLNLPA